MKKQSVSHEPEIVVKHLSFLLKSGPHPSWDNDPRRCDVAFMHDVDGNIVAVPCWSGDELAPHGRFKEVLMPMNVTAHATELSWDVIGEESTHEVHVKGWPTDWEATVLDVQGLPVRVAVEPCFGHFYDNYRNAGFYFRSLAVRGQYKTASAGFGGMLKSYHGWLEHLRPPANLTAPQEEHPDDIVRFATGPEPEYEDASWEGDEEASVVMFGEHCIDFRRITYDEAVQLTYLRSRWAPCPVP